MAKTGDAQPASEQIGKAVKDCPHRILLVDDDRMDVELALHVFRETPLADCLVAIGSAQEALDYLFGAGRYADRVRHPLPDLILLDVKLPGMDGFEVCRRIKRDPRTRDIPVFFMTAQSDTGHMMKGFAAGAVDYVDKPFQSAELLARVTTHLNLRDAHKQLELKNVLLEQEVAVRHQAEAALRRAHDELEERVRRRTEELNRLNRKLRSEIAERQQAEDALRHADRSKDEFLAILAHELRNPLAPIRSALEILRLDKGMSETSHQACAIIERQIQQMVRLVADLLDVSRISTGKLELRRERVALGDVVGLALETARPLVDRAQQVLQVSLPSEALYLHGDPTRLAQALANLLNNAAKYTARGGHIWLEARREDDLVRISVRDDGIGIDPRQLPRIFQIFTQVENADDKTRGGLGVGLALVRSLVQMHGGSIEAHSAGRGHGSEFILRLPLIGTGPHEQGESHSLPPNERSDATRLRILVVDDNEDAASTLQTLLSMIGHEVHVAHDGREAVKAVEALQPDVAILDIGLPGLDGYETAKRIRSGPAGRNPVLIALTGWGQDSDKLRAAEAGFNHHLVKPVEVDMLENLLATIRPADGQQ